MHLFIVNELTLPIHLEYGFAGVTRKEDCSWSEVTVRGTSDIAQAGLYADICRVHAGDEILFYLERPQNDIGREGGRFLGIFEVTSQFPFYEPGGGYLLEALEKPLFYRLRIRPKEIFKEGLTEWQAMDEMTDFGTIHDIPWTLIYRKMVGGRGCTPLLPHEAQTIKRMLDLRNAGQRLHEEDIGFDSKHVCLMPAESRSVYEGSCERFDRIDPFLQTLMARAVRQWEPHLQAYLMQEIGRNEALTQKLFPSVTVDWVGNEIYAGAGMQSIDILVFTSNELNRFIHLIELKSGVAGTEAASQLNRYVKWLKSHIPDISVHQIIPTIVARDVVDGFHEQLRTFLRGHGINHYRVVKIDNSLAVNNELHWV